MKTEWSESIKNGIAFSMLER